MAGINKVILIGNLGRDPEIRHLEGGVSVANFPMATTESYKDKSGNRVEQTEWHNIVMWRGLADVAEKYLRKGMTVYVEGKLRTRNYEKDGQKHYRTEILADNMTILSRKDDTKSSGDSQSQAPSGNTDVSSSSGVDDLPF
ncbi:MAG: single-stranded DNA-binding protein [Bacteroidia bacterium]